MTLQDTTSLIALVVVAGVGAIGIYTAVRSPARRSTGLVVAAACGLSTIANVARLGDAQAAADLLRVPVVLLFAAVCLRALERS